MLKINKIIGSFVIAAASVLPAVGASYNSNTRTLTLSPSEQFTVAFGGKLSLDQFKETLVDSGLSEADIENVFNQMNGASKVKVIVGNTDAGTISINETNPGFTPYSYSGPR